MSILLKNKTSISYIVNRKLLQVKLEDHVHAERQLIMLMGDDVTDRKNFIQDNSVKVANLDI